MSIIVGELTRSVWEPPVMGIKIYDADTSVGAVVSVTRTVSTAYGMTRELVRGADHLWVIGSALIRDYEAPTNVPVSYELTVHSGKITGDTYSWNKLTTTVHWLQDSMNPRSYIALRCGHIHLTAEDYEGTPFSSTYPTVEEFHQYEQGYETWDTGALRHAPTLKVKTAATIGRKQPDNLVYPVGSRLPVALSANRRGRAGLDLYITEDVWENGAASPVENLLERAPFLMLRSMPCLAVQTGASAHWQFVDFETDMPYRRWDAPDFQIDPIRVMSREIRVLGGTQIRPPAASLTIPWYTYGTVNADGYWLYRSTTTGETYMDKMLAGKVR